MATFEKRVTATGEVSWRVRIRIHGVKALSHTFKNKKRAQGWARGIEDAIKAGRLTPERIESERRTLRDVTDRYLRDRCAHLVPKERKARRRQLGFWLAEIGDVSLANLTPALVTEARDNIIHDRGVGTGTANRYLAALSAALTCAVKDWYWMPENPCAKVRRTKESSGRERFLSSEEKARLLAACSSSTDPRLYPIVLLALSTGARKNEIVSLQWSDVDLEAGRALVTQTKNKRPRMLYLTGPALAFLRELGAQRSPFQPFVFPSKRTGKPSFPRKKLDEARRRADLADFRFHDLRHTAASYLAMGGATGPQLMEIMGWTTPAMLRRYVHFFEGANREVVEAMTGSMIDETGDEIVPGESHED